MALLTAVSMLKIIVYALYTKTGLSNFVDIALATLRPNGESG